MTDAATAQITPPSDRLRARLGGLSAGVDPEAVARAEAALGALAHQFDGWMQDEVAKLEAAHARGRVAHPHATVWTELRQHAHDLKGLGGTFGFPLVTRVCAGLCRLLGDEAEAPSSALVDAHVEAVRALVRDELRDGPAAGVAICEALEARVAAETR